MLLIMGNLIHASPSVRTTPGSLMSKICALPMIYDQRNNLLASFERSAAEDFFPQRLKDS
jgi:hypothetical protein